MRIVVLLNALYAKNTTAEHQMWQSVQRRYSKNSNVGLLFLMIAKFKFLSQSTLAHWISQLQGAGDDAEVRLIFDARRRDRVATLFSINYVGSERQRATLSRL